jgi:signal transduction histidine kinase
MRKVETIAHDLNNLLTSITLFAEMLLMTADEKNPEYQSFIDLKKASDGALELAEELRGHCRAQ